MYGSDLFDIVCDCWAGFLKMVECANVRNDSTKTTVTQRNSGKPTKVKIKRQHDHTTSDQLNPTKALYVARCFMVVVFGGVIVRFGVLSDSTRSGNFPKNPQSNPTPVPIQTPISPTLTHYNKFTLTCRIHYIHQLIVYECERVSGYLCVCCQLFRSEPTSHQSMNHFT